MSHDHEIGKSFETIEGAAHAPGIFTGLLARWGARYIWWKSLEEALRYPDRIIAQVMNMGDYEDVQALVDAFGEEALRDVIRRAEAGWFNERSWVYWHIRLGLVPANASAIIPPLPLRDLP
ncbi:MAG TPA: hypothetical protein VF808_11640 [Ktedonobacterales bacterium]